MTNKILMKMDDLYSDFAVTRHKNFRVSLVTGLLILTAPLGSSAANSFSFLKYKNLINIFCKRALHEPLSADTREPLDADTLLPTPKKPRPPSIPPRQEPPPKLSPRDSFITFHMNYVDEFESWSEHYKQALAEVEDTLANAELNAIRKDQDIPAFGKLRRLEIQRLEIQKQYRKALEQAVEILREKGFKVELRENDQLNPRSFAGILLRLLKLRRETQINEALKKLNVTREQFDRNDLRPSVATKIKSLILNMLSRLRIVKENKSLNSEKLLNKSFSEFYRSNIGNPNLELAKEYVKSYRTLSGIQSYIRYLEDFESLHIEILEFPPIFRGETPISFRMLETLRKRFGTKMMALIDTKSEFLGKFLHIKDSNYIFLDLKRLVESNEPHFSTKRTAIHEAVHAFYGHRRSLGLKTDLDIALNSKPDDFILLDGYHHYLSFEEAHTWTKDMVQTKSEIERRPESAPSMESYLSDLLFTAKIIKKSLESIRLGYAAIENYRKGKINITYNKVSQNASFELVLPIATEHGHYLTFYLQGEYTSDPSYLSNEMLDALARAESKIRALHRILHVRNKDFVPSDPLQLPKY